MTITIIVTTIIIIITLIIISNTIFFIGTHRKINFLYNPRLILLIFLIIKILIYLLFNFGNNLALITKIILVISWHCASLFLAATPEYFWTYYL